MKLKKKDFFKNNLKKILLPIKSNAFGKHTVIPKNIKISISFSNISISYSNLIRFNNKKSNNILIGNKLTKLKPENHKIILILYLINYKTNLIDKWATIIVNTNNYNINNTMSTLLIQS